ncbi:MAG: endonuclease/exonuclease/phosphatase family protein [Pikeienuella sp.]
MVFATAFAILALCITTQLTKAEPPPPDKYSIRVATYDVALSRRYAGVLAQEFRLGGSPQIAAVIEIIQRVQPDVILINNFDYDLRGIAAELFRDTLSQAGPDVGEVHFPHLLSLPVNTGQQTGYDVDSNGRTGGPSDAHGFGYFPGQYGMILLSRYPFDEAAIRSFQRLRWSDMPASLIPTEYLGPAAASFRLSSKSHWDVPIIHPNGKVIHLLASNPTPPIFDGEEDLNGRRNHDEIRFWVDYIGGEDWMTDDAGKTSALPANRQFVVLGGLNQDTNDGSGRREALNALMRLAPDPLPIGPGGVAMAAVGANQRHRGAPGLDTVDLPDEPGPGNLRVDYVLPSENLKVTGAGVFWPEPDDPLFRLVGSEKIISSDHRLVWVDIQ